MALGDRTKPLIPLTLAAGLALLAGCDNLLGWKLLQETARNPPQPSPQIDQQSSPNSQASPITQTACEAYPGFAYVREGEFIAGSDRPERDYAYQISAAATAKEPDAIAAAEQALRAKGWFDNEPERQKRSLPSFCLAEHPITNQEYQVFVRATGHRPPDISPQEYQAQGFLAHRYEAVEPYRWQGMQYPPGKGQHPVVLVSYEDALAYARWRSQRDGAAYRLPTQGEWEKAARGSDGRYFPWGNQWRDEATNWANSSANHHSFKGTSPVGAYPLSRSPYGIEDMAGNVFEFTSTLSDLDQVILKGCAWDDLPGFCRAAYQHDRPINARHILFGFRLVVE